MKQVNDSPTGQGGGFTSSVPYSHISQDMSQMTLRCISSISEDQSRNTKILEWLMPNLSLFFQQAGLRSYLMTSPHFDPACPAGFNPFLRKSVGGKKKAGKESEILE